MTKKALELTGATEIALMHADTVLGTGVPFCVFKDRRMNAYDIGNTYPNAQFSKFIDMLDHELGVPIKMVSYLLINYKSFFSMK